LQSFTPEGRGSIGRAPVSKTGGWGFKSLRPCSKMQVNEFKSSNDLAKKGVTMSTTSSQRLGLFGRMSLFLRQVTFELKKVVWPTKEQLVTYTGVVIVFVTIMALIIAALDFMFGQFVLVIFG
jgi:preprotein translocase subunit SecE